MESSDSATFFQRYLLSSDQETEPSGYHVPNQDTPLVKRVRTNTGRGYPPLNNEPELTLVLTSGQVLRFHEEDGMYLLLPVWFETNLFVRRIVARSFRSVAGRLRYFHKIMNEVEGYDEEGNISYHHLRDQVMESYLVEARLRRAMRNVLMRWRIRRVDRHHQDEIDPITLSEPIKRVVLYDWNVHRKFVFDAKSLAIHVETALLYQEGGFAIPKYPRNPWNNLDFTYRQLVSIYEQLKVHGELRWAFQTLRNYNFNMTIWHRYNHSAITLNAINVSIIQLDNPNARELLEDFILTKIGEVKHITSKLTLAYRAAIMHMPRHWYIERWKNLAWIHYEALHFGLDRSDKIHEARDELLKRERRWMEELREKDLI